MKNFLRWFVLFAILLTFARDARATWQLRANILFDSVCTNGIDLLTYDRSVNGAAYSQLLAIGGTEYPWTAPTYDYVVGTATDNSGGGGDTVSFRIRFRSLLTGLLYTNVIGGGGPYGPGVVLRVTAAPSCDGTPGTNWCLTYLKPITMRNNTSFTKTAVWYFNKGLGSQTKTTRVLAPGESATVSEFVTKCGNGQQDTFEAGWEDFTFTPSNDSTNGPSVTVSNVYNPVVTTPIDGWGDTNAVSGSINPGTGTGSSGGGGNSYTNNTNSFINFSGTSSTAARDDTLKAGFNAVVEGLRSIKTSVDLGNALLTDIKRESTETSDNTSGGGGGPITGGTNDYSALQASIDAFHRDNTNVLSDILKKLSGTNTLDLTGIVTNGDVAIAQAQAAVSSVVTAVDSLSTTAASAPTETGGSGSTISIPIGSLNMTASLMPGEWSQVWAFAKRLISWLLVAAYMYSIGKGTYQMVRDMGQMTQMRIPNVNVEASFLGIGVGGNAGAIGYGVLVAAIAIIWGTVIAVMTSYLAGFSSFASVFTTNPLTGGGAAVSNGIAYLQQAIPFGLIFSLASAKVIWELTKLKAILIAQWAMRLLPG